MTEPTEEELAEFTPKPWRMSRERRGYRDVLDADGQMVAKGVPAATAPLVAAAPRLIEALRTERVETMEMLAADAAEISSLRVRVADLLAALERLYEATGDLLASWEYAKQENALHKRDGFEPTEETLSAAWEAWRNAQALTRIHEPSNEEADRG